MIRQAISCDICGAEKKQTNHWFVANEQGGEMRVSSWNARNRLRAGSKHLCGQTCLHKLLDEFLARSVDGRAAPESATAQQRASDTDAPLSQAYAFEGEESSARLIPPVEPERLPLPPAHANCARVPAAPGAVIPPRIQESVADAARRRRAEAWERERTRELRGNARRPN